MKSPYITGEGFRTLTGELDAIWGKRQDVVKHLSAAAAEGDRSENAEYIYRKKQLREIDRRIRYLQRRLPELKVVERESGSTSDKVYFCAYVTLGLEDGSQVVYRIVGGDETDAGKQWISIESPVAKALLGRRIDDEVSVRTPNGEVTYVIEDIRY